jgi:hypothetical protein
MKLLMNDPTRYDSGKVQVGMITTTITRVCRIALLIIFVSALAACNLPRPNSSAAGGITSSTRTPFANTPTTSSDAGGAVLNLERSVTYSYSDGTDFQQEIGAIPLKFFLTTEGGDLVVEGTGKTKWTEKTDLPKCKYTVEAEGAITVTGIFSKEDCLFHLTIATKLSQPVTTYTETGNCTGSVVFSKTEFTSRIELSPDSSRNKEVTNAKDSWWVVSSVKLTDLKSDPVKFCFLPEKLD